MKMDIKDIKSLIKIVMETDISEFELENPEEKIRIKRGGSQEIIHYHTPQSASIPQPMTRQHTAPPDVEIPTVSAPAADAEKGVNITSPIVGTFYRAPAPDANPYVEVGQVVEKGGVMCIIEAMKLMNEIVAEQAGTVTQALVENGQPVEYGQIMFIIE
jgi:acetyl-CoA carboxylase biotin carboxyl carrier protein